MGRTDSSAQKKSGRSSVSKSRHSTRKGSAISRATRKESDAASRGSGRRQNITPSTPEHTFLSLPMEVIRLIYSELPLPSQAALALTNKKLQSVLGILPWRALTGGGQAEKRTQFLALLEKDLCAESWLCQYCEILHRKDLLKYCTFKTCRAFESELFNNRYVTFKWAHLHLVMQRHRHGGNYGLPVGTLSSLNRIGPYDSVRKFEIQGKIIDGEVIVKARITTEGYVSMKRSRYSQDFFKVLQCRQRHVQPLEKFCADCSPQTRRCRQCAIEYDFEALPSSGAPPLCIEVWANLGSGQDINDLKWSLPTSYNSYKRVEFEPGDIRTKYESQQEERPSQRRKRKRK